MLKKAVSLTIENGTYTSKAAQDREDTFGTATIKNGIIYLRAATLQKNMIAGA
jgi:hypothetical protein